MADDHQIATAPEPGPLAADAEGDADVDAVTERVLEESEAPGSIPEVTDTKSTTTAKGKKARSAASEPTETDEAP